MTTPAATGPRRLTPTERLHEISMAAIQRKPSEPESSVTITRNARGVFQFEVTVRGPDVGDCDALARNVVTGLIEQFPYPAGPTNGGTT